MKTLILHVGLHRTATSSIQESLSRNRETLRSSGYDYPQFSINGRSIDNHSIPICSLFSDHPEKYHINIRWGLDAKKANEVYRQQLEGVLGNSENVIISGQDISLLPVNALRSLREFFNKHGFRIRVICFVRSPYRYTCSMIQQEIKGGAECLSNIRIKSPYTLVSNILKVFPDTEFVSFENSLQHPGGPVSRIYSALGLSTNEEEKITNKGFGNISTRLVNYINSVYPVMADGKISEKRIGIDRFHDDFNFDNQKFLLNKEELGVVQDDLERENENIGRVLGAEFADTNYPLSSPIVFNDEMVKFLVDYSKSLPQHITSCIYDFIRQHNYGNREILSGFFSPSEYLSADLCRNTAILWEKKSVDNAALFMRMALSRRPHGPFIKQKLSEYAKIKGGAYYQFEEAVYDGTMPMPQQAEHWSVDRILGQIDLVDCRDLSAAIRRNLKVSAGGYRSCISYLSSAQFSLEVLKQAIEHGGVTISCPLTGSAAASVGSVFFNGKNALRFHGEDVFYLIQDNFSAEIVFYPLRNIAIVLPNCLRPEWKIRALLAKLRKYASSYAQYFLLAEKPFGGVYCAHASPFHYYYFKATPIARHWRETGRSFDIITQKGASFLDLSSVLGMPQSDKFIVETITDGERNVPIEVLEKKFYVSIGDRRGSMDLATATFLDEKVRDHSWYTQDSAALFEFSAADSDRPFVLWLGITTGKRRWLEEEKCYVQLIRWFARRHQKMLVIMDGWTRPLGSAGDGNADNVYVNDKYVAERIAEQVRGENVKVVYCMGRTAVEKVAMAKEVDFFCGNHSTGSIWVSRVARRPGVTHVSNAARESVLREHVHHNVTVVPSVYVSDICERDVMSKGHVSYSISVGDFLNIVAKKVREMEDGKGD